MIKGGKCGVRAGSVTSCKEWRKRIENLILKPQWKIQLPKYLYLGRSILKEEFKYRF
jgi:hypothetical protein